MERKILQELVRWKDGKQRKPLVLNGARQVGKTYILRKFGEHYFESVVYINLEANATARKIFDGDLSPRSVLLQLEAVTMQRIAPNNTLIILDEIQACPRALTALKSFQEDAPEYAITSAGSLLGVAVHRENYSFPVGKVDEMTLFPMDFEEFLWASNKQVLAEQIRNHYISHDKMPKALHEDALDCLRQYLIVGGMPEAVGTYIATNSIVDVQNVQQHILNDYTADMAKYTQPSMIVKVRACYHSIPAQLAKENHKFQYKVVQRGGSATIFGEAIEWLNQAGVTLACQHVEKALVPVAAYADLSEFKLYMSDIGLLTLQSGMPTSLIMSPIAEDNTFMGALTENYVAQVLASKNIPLYYWRNQNTAEVDFLLPQEDTLIPVEVKKGEHVRSRSLNQYIQTYHPHCAIRLSQKNYGEEDGLLSLPLYAAFCL